MATPGSPSTPLITFEYNANDAGYAHAIARHVDSFDGNDPAGTDDAAGEDTTATIDTITFVDGLGRVRQTKRDARLSVDGRAAGQHPPGHRRRRLRRPRPPRRPVRPDRRHGSGHRVQPGRGERRADGDVVVQLRPVRVRSPSPATARRRTTTRGRPSRVSTAPARCWPGPKSTDPEGRVTTVAQDVRDVTRFHIDTPAPRDDEDGDAIAPADPDLQTEYVVNSLGELQAVVDSTGETSTYEYDLAGRLTSATTPNGGTVQTTYDLAGRRAGDGQRRHGRRRRADHLRLRVQPPDRDRPSRDGRRHHLRVRARTTATGGSPPAGSATSRTAPASSTTPTTRTVRWSSRPRSSSGTTGRPDLTERRARALHVHDDVDVRRPRPHRHGRLPRRQDGVVRARRHVGRPALTSPDQLSTLLETADLDGEVVSYDYDSGGTLRRGQRRRGGDPVRHREHRSPTPRATRSRSRCRAAPPTSTPYLNDRVYDPRLLADPRRDGQRDDLGVHLRPRDALARRQEDHRRQPGPGDPHQGRGPGPQLHLRRRRPAAHLRQRPAARQPGDQRRRRRTSSTATTASAGCAVPAGRST